jgi:PAN domain
MLYDFDTDRPDTNWDLETFNVGTRDYHACDDPCLNRSDCKSFAYYKPGIRGKDAICVLRSELPRAIQNQPCCVTGVVKERALKP